MLIRMVNSSHHLTEYAKNFTINSTNCTGLAINGTAHATNCTEHAASKHQGNDYRFWAGIAVVVILCFIVSGFSSEENRNARRSRRILNGGAEPTDLESLHNTRRAWATVDLEKITVHHISLAGKCAVPHIDRSHTLTDLLQKTAYSPAYLESAGEIGYSSYRQNFGLWSTQNSTTGPLSNSPKQADSTTMIRQRVLYRKNTERPMCSTRRRSRTTSVGWVASSVCEFFRCRRSRGISGLALTHDLVSRSLRDAVRHAPCRRIRAAAYYCVR